MAWLLLKQYNMSEDVDLSSILTQVLEDSYKNSKGNYKLWEKQINNKMTCSKSIKKSKIIFKNRTYLVNKIKEELKVI